MGQDQSCQAQREEHSPQCPVSRKLAMGAEPAQRHRAQRQELPLDVQ